MTRPRLPLPVVGILLPALVWTAGIVVALVGMPARSEIAVHWAADGSPDRVAAPWTVVVVLAILALVGTLTFGLLLLASETDGPTPTRRFLAVVAVAFAAFLSTLGDWVLLAQRDTTTEPPVGLGLLLAAGVATAAGALAALVAPRAVASAPTGRPAEALTLAPDERAVWVGRTRLATPGIVAIAVGAAAALGAAVLANVVTSGAVGAVYAVPVVLLALLLLTVSWTVRVDGTGLEVRSAAGWPRFRMPASEVAGAGVVDVQPLGEFGGWGIRGGRGRRLGIVMRSGEALEAQNRDGRALVVTVDDAGTAAALLGAVAERAERASS